MNKDQTLQALKEGFVDVTFNKVNGDERVMTCTLHEDHVPEYNGTGKKKKPVEGNQVVWDTKAEGFRTFKWDNVTKVNGEVFDRGEIQSEKIQETD